MFKLSLIVGLTICSQISFAADIAGDIRNPGSDTGGYFELGLGVGYNYSPRVDEENDGANIGLVIGGGYQYKGLFLELSQGTADGINIGYNLYEDDNWAFDILGATVSSLSSGENTVDLDASEAIRNEQILDREISYIGSGIRLTRYLDDYIFQFRLVTDVSDSNGLSSTLRAGRSWQVRNWNFHGILSAAYASAKTVNAELGISAAEATSRFTRYEPGSSINYGVELGATYPISKHLVFRSTARFNKLSSAVRRSPLIEESSAGFIFGSISYVF